MKQVVYYFSGTGNSLTVAKAIANKDAQLCSIASIMKDIQNNSLDEVQCDAEKVGFVFPVYYLGLPSIVHEFLDKITLTNPKFVYAVGTMGGTKGGMKKQVKQYLEQIEQSKEYYDREPLKFLVNKRNIPFINKVANEDKYFATTDACIGCGLCEKVCSKGNINLVEGKPIWLHSCESCLACFNYCPKHAITYKGRDDILQYHHPDVTINELVKVR